MERLKPLSKRIEELRWQIHQAEQDNDPIKAAKLSIECIELEKRLKDNEL